MTFAHSGATLSAIFGTRGETIHIPDATFKGSRKLSQRTLTLSFILVRNTLADVCLIKERSFSTPPLKYSLTYFSVFNLLTTKFHCKVNRQRVLTK